MPYIQMVITNHAEVSRVLNEVKPDVVIHCAAWTDVDAAEEPANASKVRAINAEGTRHIGMRMQSLRRENGLYQHGLCFQRAR